MAEQVNGMRRRQSTAKREPAGSTITERQRADEELKTEIDTLLDEIDAVLESNAVESLPAIRKGTANREEANDRR